MAFFTVNTTAEAVREPQGGNYLSKSGIYPVTLKIVSVTTNDHNARSLNFNVDYEGSENTLYGLKLDNNDGTANYQQRIFNNLCVVAGLQGSISDPEIQTHNLGKDKKPTDLSVLTDFTDIPVFIRIKEVYSLYNNKLQSRKEIVGFYRAEDKASASEIVNGTEAGVQYNKDLEYASDVTYKDGLTAEKVAALKEAEKSGSAPAAQTAAVTKPTKNLFAS